MQIGLAHDYLTQRGGAERVALEMTRIFPKSPLTTSVYSNENTFADFRDVPIRTTWLQKVKAVRQDPRLGLPLMTSAWSHLKPLSGDAVVVSSTGFAHGVPVEAGTRKVVYCHNPPRWIYQPDDYLNSRGARLAMKALRPRLLDWDQKAAASADTYLANSTGVAQRILEAYGITAPVVHPPVVVDTAGPQEAVAGVQPGFWLAIARGRGYKNVQAVADAVARLKGHALVVAGSASSSVSGKNVTALGLVSEAQLRWLYSNARGLVTVSFEDFGLTPIEANAFGTPVAVLRAGGFLDSTQEGSSGMFIESATADAVEATLASFPEFSTQAVLANAARFSPEGFAQRLRETVTSIL